MTGDTDSRTHRTATSTRTHTRAATVTRYTTSRSGVVGSGVAWSRRAARRSARVARRTGRFLRDTVMPAGWLLAALLVAGVVLGATLGWVEAWAVAVVAALLLLASAPFLLGGHDYGVSLHLERDRVVAGTDVGGWIDIVNRARRVALPGVVDVPVGEGLVEAHVPLLRAGGQHREPLAIAARRRGVITVGPLTIGRGDPVGFLRREITWPEEQQIFVHPVTVPVPSTSQGLIRDLEGQPTSDIVDADLSFHAIRDYAAGDSQRHIHWKSTAKTGQLMVRQYEESRRSRIAVLLGLRHDDEHASEDEFEMAVSAAASLAAQGVRDGRDVLVSMSAEISEYEKDSVKAIRTLPTLSAKGLLDAMSGVQGSSTAMALGDVAKLTVQTYPELSIALVVTGSLLPLPRLRAIAIAFPPDVAVVAVRCEPGAEPTLRTTPELSVLTVGALHDLTRMLARGAGR